jgi:alpha-amylase
VPNDREALWLSGYSTTSELYTWVSQMNQIRNQAIYKDAGYLLYKAYPIYSDDTTIALRKGDDASQIISVYTNQGSGASSYTSEVHGGEEARFDLMCYDVMNWMDKRRLVYID